MNQQIRTSTAQYTNSAPGWSLKLGDSLGLGAWVLGISRLVLGALPAVAQEPFQFPTANHALYESGGEERFFVGTVGKPWTSGCFGCVRSDGWQIHEGLDIRCLQRDKHGEPTD